MNKLPEYFKGNYSCFNYQTDNRIRYQNFVENAKIGIVRTAAGAA